MQMSDFRILQNGILLLWDHSLLNTATFKGTDLVAFQTFNNHEWGVRGKTTTKNLNIIIYYSTVCLDIHYNGKPNS